MTLYFGQRSGKALKDLVDQGIDWAVKPHYAMPRVPMTLTEIGDEDLMILYTQFTAYADFIAVQLACAQVDEREAEKVLSALETKKMLSSQGKTANRVTFARAEVASDEEVLKAKEEVESKHAYRKLVEVMANNLERDASLVSRELTRRTSSRSRVSTSRFSA